MSGLRARQADLTRRAILEAARKLFTEHGYPSATVRVLAEKAGVAVRTVYLAFGSKQGVLLALIDDMAKVAGEDEGAAEAARATDGETLVRIVARVYRRFYERDFDLIATFRQSASFHPELKAAFEHGRALSRTNVGLICARIDQLGQLRAGRDLDETTGHALTLVSPDAFEELVRLRGWSHDRYESWLAQALSEAVVVRNP